MVSPIGSSGSDSAGSLSISEPVVLAALRGVDDPELGVNVVDLGLIYRVAVDGRAVRIEMTLTTPGCPLHASMTRAVEAAVWTMVPGVEDVTVDLVWEPAWTPDRLTADGRQALGWT